MDFLTFASGESLNGHTLVVHECAHKLEALDGIVNGKPLLHRDIRVPQLADVFGAA